MIDVPAELDRMLDRPDTDIDGIIAGISLKGETTVSARGSWPGSASAAPHSMLYAASLTKQLVGLLTAISVELGELATSDPLRRWMPTLPPWSERVTVDHLIHHTSGLPLHVQPEGADRTTPSVLEAVNRLASRGTQPGERFEYSNDGYVLLALTLSRATGRSIEQLASERVFTPLGMSSSSLRSRPLVRIADEPPPPATIGDGGWWTTVPDLLTFLAALNAGVFDAAGSRVMERGKLAAGDSIDYAWGVRAVAIQGSSAASHGGTWQRWQSKAVRIPSLSCAVAVAARTFNAEAISDLAMDLATASLAPADRSRAWSSRRR